MKHRRYKKRTHFQNTVLLILSGALIFIAAAYGLIYWQNERTLANASRLISYAYPLPPHKYDWSNLTWSEGYQTVQYEDDNYTSELGVDVSYLQGDIDWHQVADAGVKFAFIRSAYRGYSTGQLLEDPLFDTNMKQAQANGIACGVYVYSQAIDVDEAAEEAEMVIHQLRKYPLQLPVVFDLETSKINDQTVRAASSERIERTQAAVTFMNLIQKAGYQAMIYGSASLFEDIYDLQYLQDYQFWVASYTHSYPQYPYEFNYWQYTSEGRVAGIDKNVDMDIRFIEKSPVVE